MRFPRILPVALSAIALGTLLVFGAACGGDGDDDEETATAGASVTRTTTTAASSTPTEGATNTPTAVPTPTPYNGQITNIRLPRLGISAPIEELAINAVGELDTPKAENTAVGWYYIYDKPGRVNPDNRGWIDWGGKTDMHGFYGNAVFSAHVYYGNVPAPFVNLASSVPGDEVIITMEDGRQYTYTVFSNERYHRDTIDMGQVIWPTAKPAEEEWITLITCGGELDSTGQEYLSRDVVIARRQP